MDCVLGTDGQEPEQDTDGWRRGGKVANGCPIPPAPPSTALCRPRSDGPAVLLRNHNVVRPDSICGITNSLVGTYLPMDDSGTLVALENDAGWQSRSAVMSGEWEWD